VTTISSGERADDRRASAGLGLRGTAALTDPATYDARVRVVSSMATSTTLLVTDALATTTGMTTVPRATSVQPTTGVGAALSWRVL
jgi:hypothetical protein